MANIYFLHGFLGKPQDWRFLKDAFPTHQSIFLNLFHDFNPKEGLQSFASALNNQLMGSDNILIGYSLGGRLGLHALLKNPACWRAAVLISTHPGIASKMERRRRLIHDQSWAERFLAEDWNTLIEDWNQQPVLQTSGQIKRCENDFNRTRLADSLLNWGLGHQEDLREPIRQFPQPVYWLAGERDDRYSSMATECRFLNPHSKVIKMKDAGHRAPWDQQQAFISEIQSLFSL